MYKRQGFRTIVVGIKNASGARKFLVRNDPRNIILAVKESRFRESVWWQNDTISFGWLHRVCIWNDRRLGSSIGSLCWFCTIIGYGRVYWRLRGSLAFTENVWILDYLARNLILAENIINLLFDKSPKMRCSF